MKKYTVKEVANLAGVSVRTLHHYDQIGLLSPKIRSTKGYRQYDHSELLLLQSIRFYRQLGFPLKEIIQIVHDPKFDLLQALKEHRIAIVQQQDQLGILLQTIDKTIKNLKKERMMTEQEMYAGFKPNEVQIMREEVKARWGAEELLVTETKINEMGKAGWDDVKKKGKEINQLLAELSVLEPDHIQAQKAVALHLRHINHFYEVTKERYLGLAQMYVADDRFRAHYDQFKVDLADWLLEAIKVYCANWKE